MPKSDKEIITSYGILEERVSISVMNSQALVFCNPRNKAIIYWVYISEDDHDHAMPEMMTNLKNIIFDAVRDIENDR